MDKAKGFFASLFDFSFTQFVTTRIVKLLYGLGIVLAGLGAISLIVGGFSRSPAVGVVTILLSPLVFLIYVILARVWLELIIVIFRIAEHTRDMASRGQAGT